MLPRSGRPLVLSAEQERDIIERITADPFLTAVGFAREFGVNEAVISRLFRRHEIKCRTAAKTLRLTEEHRTNRIAFCQVLLEHWDDNRLQSIVFSDEKTFSTDVSWRSKVYRPDNTRHHPEYLKVSDRSGRITNNYWGAIGYDGPVTPLVTVNGRFDARKYMSIVRQHVIPVMEKFEDDGEPRIFMQDNCPVHKAANVMALFSRQRFQLLDWPAKSPDLNPIENVWSKMEFGWPTIYPRTTDNLHDVVQQRWHELYRDPREFFLKLNFKKNMPLNCIFHFSFFQNTSTIYIDHCGIGVKKLLIVMDTHVVIKFIFLHFLIRYHI